MKQESILNFCQVVGGSLQLGCTATGLPAPRITFKIGEKEFSGEEVDHGNNVSTVQLSLNHLTVEQEGNYVCVAVNEYGADRASTEVEVYSRTAVTLEGGSQTVESGRPAIFPCTVSVDPRLQSSLEVTWLKNETPLEETLSGRISWNSKQLEVLETVSEDEGRYTCAASSSKDSAAASGQLTVLHEEPTFTSTSIDVRVLEGGDTLLECKADGIPVPTISWSFGGKQLETKDSSLELEGMSRSMEGEYVCTATNTYGEIEKIVNVAVIRGVRRETDNLVPDLVKNIKETILLPCDFKVDSRVEDETEFQWLRDDMELDYKAGDKFELLENRSLKIKDLVLEDKGRYTCRVTNSLEQTETHIQLIISGMGPHIINDFRKVAVQRLFLLLSFFLN